MKTTERFNHKPVLSYEVFPPTPASPVDKIYQTLSELAELQPDFISVTYGAARGTNRSETFRIAAKIKELGVESASHLTCITTTKEDVRAKLTELKELGIENILALRGDLPEGNFEHGDFEHASDLITFIKSEFDCFNIIAACHPEGHLEAESKVRDIQNLKLKVDAGANHLISQLFFSNDYFYQFLERCQLADIIVPIEAGIMPVTNKRQIERMSSLCGATLPPKFVTMMEKYEDNPVAMRDAGIAYAVDQIVDLFSQNVDGVHLYTMNNPYVARKIHEAVHHL